MSLFARFEGQIHFLASCAKLVFLLPKRITALFLFLILVRKIKLQNSEVLSESLVLLPCNYVCHAEVNTILNRNHASAARQVSHFIFFVTFAHLFLNSGVQFLTLMYMIYHTEALRDHVSLQRMCKDYYSGVSEVIYYVEKHLDNPDVAYVASHKLLSMAGIKVRRHEPQMDQILIKFYELLPIPHICFGTAAMASHRTPVSRNYAAAPDAVTVPFGDNPLHPIAVVLRRSYHGGHARVDHRGRGKGKFNSQEADGWQRKPLSNDSSNAVIASNNNNVGEASENSMMYPVGKVEGDLAEVCDSADIQAQKEEEERVREQKAKALAKLEELDRRKQAGANQKAVSLTQQCTVRSYPLLYPVRNPRARYLLSGNRIAEFQKINRDIDLQTSIMVVVVIPLFGLLRLRLRMN
ncbi:uncharacterized protein LOC125188512 isoform X2 [Salvia hispanica]|uniref:uncharacterized protein LOC125188512 isoform X2 n=1 Tax=Salvia hispanica TaxID=49212 RepID=UPI0020097AA4|nr:uncharacterized protein LOC125188512 isoform X2 [Salvia hispanica]